MIPDVSGEEGTVAASDLLAIGQEKLKAGDVEEALRIAKAVSASAAGSAAQAAFNEKNAAPRY